MIVVADSSPLSYLIRLGHVEILPQLFGRVLIPPAVYAELLHSRAPEGVRCFAAVPPDWLEIKAPLNPKPLSRLDPGEAAAINLAKQEDDALLLIDELAGREIASSPEWGIRIMGTIGILERAAAQELLDLSHAIGQLRGMRFHVSADVIREALARDAARRKQ